MISFILPLNSIAYSKDSLKLNNFEIRSHFNYTSLYYETTKFFKPKLNYGGSFRYRRNINSFFVFHTGIGLATKGITKIFIHSYYRYYDKFTNTFITKKIDPPIVEDSRDKGYSLNIPLGFGMNLFNNKNLKLLVIANYVRSFNYFPESKNKYGTYTEEDKNQLLIEFPLILGSKNHITVTPNYSVSLNMITFTNNAIRYYFYGLDLGYTF